MSTRSAETIASMAASTSERETLRAVSSTLTWSAATAVSNSLWSSEKSGSGPPAGGPGGRREERPGAAAGRAGDLAAGDAAPILLARGALQLGEALEAERLREAHH